MTGRVVYPDVWWRRDAAGLRDPLLAELEERFRHL
jgi:putative acetyltransferase